MRNIRTNLFNPISSTRTDFLFDHVISIADGSIQSIRPFTEHEGAWEDKRNCICIPGMIDLHVHLSQYRIRGMYHPALLPWLNKSVFPEEAKSQNPYYATDLSRDFFKALLRVGTTYSLIYTAPFREAADAAFEVAKEMGIKARIGMTLMDMNSPKELQHTTDYALKHSIELHELWQDPFLAYIFTPRFAPTCSAELMRQIGIYAKDNDAFIQTHLSENKDEIDWVKEIFKKESYSAVYDEFGILGERTIFGHAIHLSETELKLLKQSNSAIAHCPDSNFYLKSGEYPLKRISDIGIPFGLGSDVGAGTSLNMLYHAKQMNFRQSTYPVLPAEMLYRITLGNAKIVGLESRIGSLEVGKEADLVFFQVPQGLEIGKHILGQLCFSSASFPINKVMVSGTEMPI